MATFKLTQLVNQEKIGKYPFFLTIPKSVYIVQAPAEEDGLLVHLMSKDTRFAHSNWLVELIPDTDFTAQFKETLP